MIDAVFSFEVSITNVVQMCKCKIMKIKYVNSKEY